MIKRNSLINFFLFCLSISIPIVLADSILKILRLPSANSRVMLLAGGEFTSNTKTYVKAYTPNKLIRQAAVYGKSLEFDYKFYTDKYGFRKGLDCRDNKNKISIAITGDSYTDAQGSETVWITPLQKLLCKKGINSNNVSASGIGIIDMKNHLIFAKNTIGSEKAIIAMVPEDIYRGSFPMESNDRCSGLVTRPFSLCKTPGTWWHVPMSITKNDAIKFANKKYNLGLVSSIKVVLRDLKTTLYDYKNESNNATNPRIKASVDSVKEISKIYGKGNIFILIMPTKNDRLLEGNKKELLKRNQDLKLFLNNIDQKITFSDIRSCPLNKEHFFNLDGHPNSSGQDLLGKCAVNDEALIKFLKL